MDSKKHPIIARGEEYVEPIVKKLGWGNKPRPHEYKESKIRLINDIDKINRQIVNKSEIFLDEKFLCVRLEPDFEAKSYCPESLVKDNNEMGIVGGRKYSFFDDNGDKQTAKLYFLKTSDSGIEALRYTLKEGGKDNQKRWQEQISSIHSLDLLKPEEKIMGITEEWESGIVEIVLHPMDIDRNKMISLFYKTIGIHQNRTKIKSYDGGLTFISAKCTRKEIEKIKRFNPLRALHPLGNISITPIRSIGKIAAPKITPANKKSKITVGIFDGGIDETIPLLSGYSKAFDSVSSPPNLDYMAHGTAVCGAVLFGNLAGQTNDICLPAPCVSVDSFRVLPTEKVDDLEAYFELYESIDAIEKVVKDRSDIKLTDYAVSSA